MSELTKEYLDKKLDKLTTKDDLKRIDNKIETLATKKDLEDLEGNLMSHIEEEIGKLAVMTSNGLEEIKRELDVRTQVENLDHRMIRIEQALNIKS